MRCYLYNSTQKSNAVVGCTGRTHMLDSQVRCTRWMHRMDAQVSCTGHQGRMHKWYTQVGHKLDAQVRCTRRMHMSDALIEHIIWMHKVNTRDGHTRLMHIMDTHTAPLLCDCSWAA